MKKVVIPNREEYFKEPDILTENFFTDNIVSRKRIIVDKSRDVPCASRGKTRKFLNEIDTCPICNKGKVAIHVITAYDSDIWSGKRYYAWRMNCINGCFITEYYVSPLKAIVSYIKRLAIMRLIDELFLEKEYLRVVVRGKHEHSRNG